MLKLGGLCPTLPNFSWPTPMSGALEIATRRGHPKAPPPRWLSFSTSQSAPGASPHEGQAGQAE